jgi:multicomponent K+:H+ antiporter subunit A
LIGPVPLASALPFDLGVFLLVVGATVLMLIAIAHQSVRGHRMPSSSAPVGPATSPKDEER